MHGRNLRDFEKAQSKELLHLLRSRQIMASEESDGLVHALIDIAVSIEKVYFDVIPKLLSEPNATTEIFKDRLWDLREEFRHIDYHIHDSKLTEL